MKTIKHILPLLGAGLVLAGAGAPLAQGAEFQSPREIAAFLGERMPPFLKDEALRRRLVGDMLNVKPTRLAFDANAAIKLLTGDGSVLLSTDCRRPGTPVGERDPGDCTASIGDETGPGEFSRLSYSKSIGFGNIKFIKRPAVPTQLPDPEKLPSPKLGDREAYDAARKLLVDLGLPLSELPDVPAGVPGGLPVRNLNVQGGGEKPLAPITIRKVVFQQRGFLLREQVFRRAGAARPYARPGAGEGDGHVRRRRCRGRRGARLGGPAPRTWDDRGGHQEQPGADG